MWLVQNHLACSLDTPDHVFLFWSVVIFHLNLNRRKRNGGKDATYGERNAQRETCKATFWAVYLRLMILLLFTRYIFIRGLEHYLKIKDFLPPSQLELGMMRDETVWLEIENYLEFLG